MMKDIIGSVRVSKKIQPLLRFQRIEPILSPGGDYYISFGDNSAYPCKLLNVINEYSKTEVSVQIMCKSRKMVRDAQGNKSRIYPMQHLVYATEIGITPEDAVRNSV